jgi:hypothetical protein
LIDSHQTPFSTQRGCVNSPEGVKEFKIDHFCGCKLLIHNEQKIPKSIFSHLPRGWRFAYPGKASKMIFNPEGVAACLMGVLASLGINHEYILSSSSGP